MQKFDFILAIFAFILAQSMFGQSLNDNLDNDIAPELGPLPEVSNSNAAFVGDLLIPRENNRQKRAANRMDSNGFQQFLNSNPQLKSFLKDLVANGDKHLSTAFDKLTEHIPKGSSTMPPSTEVTTKIASSFAISSTIQMATTSNPSSTSSGKPPSDNDAEVMIQFMAFTFLDMAKGFFEKPDKKKGGGAKN